MDALQQADFVGQITRLQTALRGYVISLMPGMSGVSDVVQEVNLVLWEKRAKFAPGTNFKAWAFAIARLEVKAHRRKLFRIGAPVLDDDLAEELAAHTEPALAETDERLQALDHCLTRLGEQERQLIEHRYFSGATLEEFSSQCGRPVESLRVSLFRLRAGLRKCINDKLVLSRTLSS